MPDHSLKFKDLIPHARFRWE